MGSAAARWDDGMGRVRRAMPPQNAISSPLAASRPRPLPSVDLRFHSGAQTLKDDVIILIIKVAKEKSDVFSMLVTCSCLDC